MPTATREYDGRCEARAKLAYDTFRNGFRNAPIPEWNLSPPWVRDIAVVCYLQGKLDAGPEATSLSAGLKEVREFLPREPT
jgi:hypothetical protein